jgi:hypothetical protein
MGQGRSEPRRRVTSSSARRLIVAALVLALCGVTAACASVTRAPRAAQNEACWQQFGSFAAGHWPPGCWRPYAPSSPFNTPIPAKPRLAPDSAAIASYLSSEHWTFASGRHGAFAIEANGSRPVYWARSSDPLVKVICRGDGSCDPGLRLHIPAGARPQDEFDGHMTVVDQPARREFDFWRAGTPERGQITVSAASSIPIGPASGSGRNGSGEAAHLGLMGGLLRAAELKAGVIEHALAMAVPCEQPNDVWPAPARARGDQGCSGHGAGPHLGSLVQLNMSEAQIAASGAPAWQRAIMRAMARYGIYVVDSNSPGNLEMSLIKENDLSFTSFGFPGPMASLVKPIGGGGSLVGVPIDVSKLRVIAPCVPRRTC